MLGQEFLAITDANDNVIFINPNQIRVVDEVRKEHCRVCFSETHSIEFNGLMAAWFLDLLVRASRSIAATLSTHKVPTLTNKD